MLFIIRRQRRITRGVCDQSPNQLQVWRANQSTGNNSQSLSRSHWSIVIGLNRIQLNQIVCTSGSRGLDPPIPKIFSKLCSFQAILSKVWDQGPPRVKAPLAPLEQNPGSAPGVLLCFWRWQVPWKAQRVLWSEHQAYCWRSDLRVSKKLGLEPKDRLDEFEQKRSWLLWPPLVIFNGIKWNKNVFLHWKLQLSCVLGWNGLVESCYVSSSWGTLRPRPRPTADPSLLTKFLGGHPSDLELCGQKERRTCVLEREILGSGPLDLRLVKNRRVVSKNAGQGRHPSGVG